MMDTLLFLFWATSDLHALLNKDNDGQIVMNCMIFHGQGMYTDKKLPRTLNLQRSSLT